MPHAKHPNLVQVLVLAPRYTTTFPQVRELGHGTDGNVIVLLGGVGVGLGSKPFAAATVLLMPDGIPVGALAPPPPDDELEPVLAPPPDDEPPPEPLAPIILNSVAELVPSPT